MLLLPLASAQAQAPAGGEGKTRKGEPAAAVRGFLCEVRKGDLQLWFAGTIHVGRAEFYPLRPQILQAVRTARASSSRPTCSMRSASRRSCSGLPTFRRANPASTRASIRHCEAHRGAAARATSTSTRLSRMKPWMLANMLAFFEAGRAGLMPAHSVEALLNTAARDAGKALGELETIELQFGLFDTAPPTCRWRFSSRRSGIENGAPNANCGASCRPGNGATGRPGELVATMRAASTPAERFVIDRSSMGATRAWSSVSTNLRPAEAAPGRGRLAALLRTERAGRGAQGARLPVARAV